MSIALIGLYIFSLHQQQNQEQTF